MESENNRRNWKAYVGGTLGASLLAYGIYRVLKNQRAYDEIDLEPAQTPAHPHPYYEPHPHGHEEPVLPKNKVSHSRPHVGNNPGERNQIGGRTSGKKARY